jgi:ATP-binding cassette, subfamily B, bacterial MsbA
VAATKRPLLSDDSLGLLPRLVGEQARLHWRGYAIAFVFMGLIALTTALAAYLMKDVINEVFVNRDRSMVIWLAGTVMVIYIVKGAATYGQQVTLARIANAIVATIQTRLYSHILAMRVGYFAEATSTELIARQSFIAQSSANALNLVVISVGRDLLTLIGLVTVMAIQQPTLALISLLILPVAVVAVRKLVGRARKVRRVEFGSLSEIVGIIQETVQGIRIVKAFTLEGMFSRRMAETVERLQGATNKLAAVGARTSPLMETLGGVAIGVVILYGGYSVIDGGQTPGAFFSFITALLLAYEPAKRLARVNVDLGAQLVGVRMLYDFLDIPADEIEPPGRPDLKVEGGAVSFKSVRFHYRPDEPVLNGLYLEAAPGRTTALVGLSGGGKTTVMNLLLRFYEAHQGEVLIDGQDVRSVSLPSLRRQIAFVSQDTFLFRGTVRDNIAMGRPDASEADIMAAAKAAYADDFIRAFAKGYDTEIGEQGTQLSGGQRQRLAIARAILKNAPIILLDEATAALDSESERAVQMALERLAQGRTTIVIAHRLQTILNADKICVIEAGRIVEEGTHDELLARGGRYRALHETQFKRDSTAA